jgi:hypothetical protein
VLLSILSFDHEQNNKKGHEKLIKTSGFLTILIPGFWYRKITGTPRIPVPVQKPWISKSFIVKGK